MDVQPGTRLGPYEVLAPLGAGGMGQVFKARDTRVGRVVAVKTSRDEFTERFAREAQAVASLNHPHICQLYDVGSNYLVLEYVEGSPLAGPLPVGRALELAQQIASALDAAHSHHIVHRDLKPSNILVTKAGVKLLDFGLAKMEGQAIVDAETMAAGVTAKGQILGTLLYMSPEQVNGQEAGPRSDIFAFGLVLYEMLTGKRAFEGATPASVIAAILERPSPSVSAVAPGALDRIVATCLAKDPEDRWQSARDLERALSLVAATLSSTAATGNDASGVRAGDATGDATRRSSVRRPWAAALPWAVAAASLVSTATLGVLSVVERPAPPLAARFEVAGPLGAGNSSGPIRISPDGRMLVGAFTVNRAAQLWVRSMDALAWRVVDGTDGAFYPFWSPDSASLGFFAQDKLRTIPVAGGIARVLADVTQSARGGAWSEAGIVYSPNQPGPMFFVSAEGGTPRAVTQPGTGNENDRFPEFLPDGRRFLFWRAIDNPDLTGLSVGSIDGGPQRRLLPEYSNVAFVPRSPNAMDGHVVFRRDLVLMAQPFDAEALQTTGGAVPIARDLRVLNIVAGDFSASRAGTITYATAARQETDLVWFDRSGRRAEGTVVRASGPSDFRLSYDGQRVAYGRLDDAGREELWIKDAVGSGLPQRFTEPVGNATRAPLWSPDGKQLMFYAIPQPGEYGQFRSPTAGGQRTKVVGTRVNGEGVDWSRDGRLLLFRQQGQRGGSDLWMAELNDGVVVGSPALFQGEAGGAGPAGARIAPTADSRTRFVAHVKGSPPQVWIESLPSSGQPVLVSRGAGTAPTWRGDGRELYYVEPAQGNGRRRLMAVPVTLGTSVQVGPPRVLFDVDGVGGPRGGYEPAPDGQRFLMAVQSGPPPSPRGVTLLLNWRPQ